MNMTAEERFLEAIDEEGGEELEPLASHDWPTTRREGLKRRNKPVIDNFLGKGNRANAVLILPGYYSELLAWALQRHIERKGWKIICALGYHSGQPSYVDVSTDCDKSENILMDGQLLLERDHSHFIATVDLLWLRRSSVQVEGPARKKNEIEEFVNQVKSIAREENFYRGKKIEFATHPPFENQGQILGQHNTGSGDEEGTQGQYHRFPQKSRALGRIRDTPEEGSPAGRRARHR